MFRSIAAVSIGGTLGCLLRWWLGILLNGLFPALPPGTLAANFIGAYVIGVAIAFFSVFSSIAPEWRLFVITGFCGGLTTFSTYSAELVALLQQDRPGWACGVAAVHLFGSVSLTLAGIATVAWLKS